MPSPPKNIPLLKCRCYFPIVIRKGNNATAFNAPLSLKLMIHHCLWAVDCQAESREVIGEISHFVSGVNRADRRYN